MPILLPPRLKRLGTIVLVAVYAFVVLAPAFDFALDPDASIVHALSEAHGGVLLLHVHHDHDDHPSAGGSSKNSRSDDHCCGVYALPGLPPPHNVFVAQVTGPDLIAVVPQDDSSGHNPPRPDRPPRRRS